MELGNNLHELHSKSWWQNWLHQNRISTLMEMPIAFAAICNVGAAPT